MEIPQIKLDSEYIFYPIRKLIEVSHSSTLIGLRAIENIEEHPNPTFDEVQLIQFGNVQEKNIDECKVEFKKWILTKGFEEIHSAVRNSLERFLIFITIHSEYRNRTFNIQEFQNFEKQTTSKTRRLNYPTLVKNIVAKIGENLLYQEHIESINNARNCLVHDFGLITPIRCNNNQKNQLLIKGSKFNLFTKTQDDDEKHPFKIGDILSSPYGLFIKAENFILEFNVGENLSISYEQYAQILSTCIFYESDLREKLKRYWA